MKRSPIVYIIPVLLAVVFSCKKNDSAPGFSAASATGFWRGYISTGAVVAILNQADGSSSFYAFLPNLDTATAAEKLYGRYTVTNGIFHANYATLTLQPFVQDTLSAETIQATPHYMTGVMINSQRYNDTVTSVNALTFELIKQQ
jgi:hypothetical protein